MSRSRMAGWRRPRPSTLLAAWLAWIAIGSALPAMAADLPGVIVFQRAGELFRKDGATLTPTQESAFAPGTALQSGRLPEGAAPESLIQTPPAAWAALGFAPGEVVTLSTGASAARTGGDEQPAAYTLDGAAHLLVDAGPERLSLALTLNGLPLRIAKAHLFYNGWARPPYARVVRGEARLLGPGAEADREGMPIVPGQRLVMAPDGTLVEGEPAAPGAPAPDDPFLTWSTIPGFEAPGPYRRVGDAYPSDQRLRVVRNDVIAQLSGEKLPVFEGDQLLSEETQKVRVEFTTGDKVRLSGKTVFKIDEFLPERREKPSMVFSLLGRVRSLIVSRLAPDAVRFNAPTATIGVKGTDFNTIGVEELTTVETLDGTVGVANPEGLGEVLVGPGMQTTVPRDQLPAEPTPIPAERLEELQAEAIVAAAVAPAPVAATTVQIQSPRPDQVLREVTATYTVEPAEAAVDVLLDDQPVAAPSGTTLTMTDGPHTLVVRGTGEGAPSATVRFMVDTTPPAATANLAALTVPAGGTLAIAWDEPVSEASLGIAGQTLPLALATDGLSGQIAANPSVMTAQPAPITLRLVDRAGNVTELTGALALLVATAVQIQSPRPDQVLREVTATYTVEPAEAAVDVLLDDQLVAAPSGTTLTMTDGPHTLVVRGTGEGAPSATVRFMVDTTPPAATANLAALTVPAEGTLAIAWNEPVSEATLVIAGQTLPLALAADGLSGQIAANPSVMTAQPAPITLRLVDRAGNVTELTGALALAQPPTPPPPPPAAAAPGLCARLKQAYEETIAGSTGTGIDEVYLNMRGEPACAGVPPVSGADQLPGEPVYHPERRPGQGMASQLDETFLNDLQ